MAVGRGRRWSVSRTPARAPVTADRRGRVIGGFGSSAAPAGRSPRCGAARPRRRGVRRCRGRGPRGRVPRRRPRACTGCARRSSRTTPRGPRPSSPRTWSTLGVRAAAVGRGHLGPGGARMLAERLPRGSRVLVIGGPGSARRFVSAGWCRWSPSTTGPSPLMQGYGPDVGWRQLAEGSLGDRARAALGRHQPGPDHPEPARARPRQRVDGRRAAPRHRRRAARGRQARAAADARVGGAIRRACVRSWWAIGSTPTSRARPGPGSPRCSCSPASPTGRTSSMRRHQHRPTYLGHDLRALLAPRPPVEVRWGAGAVEGRCGACGCADPHGRAPSPGALRAASRAPESAGTAELMPLTETCGGSLRACVMPAATQDHARGRRRPRRRCARWSRPRGRSPTPAVTIAGPAQVHAATG